MAGRGWGGSPPSSDDEARARIIAAAMTCLDRYGAEKTGLSDVAAELGVTRQTVYRLYASTDDLMFAVLVRAGERFVERMVARVRGETDLAEMLVECLAFTLERLPHEQYLAMVFPSIRGSGRTLGITSPTAFALADALFDRLPIDWAALGLLGRARAELAEIYLRTLQSFVLDPGPNRTRGERRALLRAWLGPSVHQQIGRVAHAS